jgi:hypothetical protein
MKHIEPFLPFRKHHSRRSVHRRSRALSVGAALESLASEGPCLVRPSKTSSGLHVFDALVRDLWGPVAHLFVREWSRDVVDGVTVDCLTPELRSLGEIETYRRLMHADLDAAFDKAERDFRNLESKPREPLSRV